VSIRRTALGRIFIVEDDDDTIVSVISQLLLISYISRTRLDKELAFSEVRKR
jgi:hypothetical protein